MNEKNLILNLTNMAKRPIIIVGNGVRMAGAQSELSKFRLCSGIPFVTTWATKDMFVEGTAGFVGTFGVSATKYGNLAVQNADLIISLGCRLDTHMAGPDWIKFAPGATKIIVDIDKAELDKHPETGREVRVLANVKEFLEELNLYIWPLAKKDYSRWLGQIEKWKEEYPICPDKYYDQKEYVNPYVFMNELSKATKDGDIIITDAGATLTWTMQGYKIRHKDQRLFSAFNHSPMGYALPASIGAHYGAPGSRVICITGDGGLTMNIQELETIAFNRLPIITFVMNNSGYGIIRQTQDTWLDGRHSGTGPADGLGMPDFLKVAQAFGLAVTEIFSHKDINENIECVLKYDKPILCEVLIDSEQTITPKLMFGKSLEEI